jgi:hypothetical protein
MEKRKDELKQGDTNGDEIRTCARTSRPDIGIPELGPGTDKGLFFITSD